MNDINLGKPQLFVQTDESVMGTTPDRIAISKLPDSKKILVVVVVVVVIVVEDVVVVIVAVDVYIIVIEVV